MVKRQIIGLILAFGLGVVTFWLASTLLHSTPPPNSFRRQANYKFINPLLDCFAEYRANEIIGPVKTQLQKLIADQKQSGALSTIAIYYRDLNNGPWLGINEKSEFDSASLMKIPIMIKILQKSQSDPQFLTKTILIKNIDYYQDQNILDQHKLSLGESYSVEELLERMIIYSDNVAYFHLLEVVNLEEIKQIYQDFGVDVTDFPNSVDKKATVRDYGQILRILFNASYLNEQLSEQALELLSRSNYQQGIVAGVPKEVNVAHKFGERKYRQTDERQLHDCGIVYAPNQPYVLCIMTRGKDFVKLSKIIASISQLFYSHATQ